MSEGNGASTCKAGGRVGWLGQTETKLRALRVPLFLVMPRYQVSRDALVVNTTDQFWKWVAGCSVVSSCWTGRHLQ